MPRLSLPILLVFCLALSACSTSRKEQLSEVKRGMSKAEVLALVGNPSRTGRASGADRWSYDIKDKHQRRQETVEVYFVGGEVQYVGSEQEFQRQLEAQRPAQNSNDSEFREL